MSNVLPLAFLRPSCATLRSSFQWSVARNAVKKNFCSSQNTRSFTTRTKHISSDIHSRPSFSSLIRKSSSPKLDHSLRAFTTFQCLHASVSNPPKKNANEIRKIKVPQLPNGTLNKSTIHNIFGSTITEKEGNGVLRILHHRRVTGSLADLGVSNLRKRYPQLTDNLAMQGLEWLRQTFPVDEEAAAADWAEKEAERLEEDIRRERYRKMGLYKDGQEEEEMSEYTGEYKPGESVGKLYEEEYKPIETSEPGGRPTSESVFERIRRENRLKRLEEDAIRGDKRLKKKLEEEEMIARGEAVRGPLGLMKPDERVTKFLGIQVIDDSQSELAKKQRKAAEIIDVKSKEELESKLTSFQRLFPTTLFALASVIVAYLYATHYSEPDNANRLWPWLPMPMATVVGLLAVNYLFFLAWHVRPLWPYLNRYFLSVPGFPRAVSALGNVVSHQFSSHLLMNMVWLMTIGWWCATMVPRGTFLSTYFVSGIFGSTFSLYNSVLTRSIFTTSLGASGAMYGITCLALISTDANSLKVPFVDYSIPFNPRLLLAGLIATEVLLMRGQVGLIKKAVEKTGDGVDHWSHLGGMAAGCVVGAWLKYGDLVRERLGLEVPVKEERVAMALESPVEQKEEEEMNPIEGADQEEVKRLEAEEKKALTRP